MSDKYSSYEDLLGGEEQRTSTVTLKNGTIVKIKELKIGDLAEINQFNAKRGWADDPYRVTIGIIVRGLLEPKLNLSQAENLPVVLATEITGKITEFSGWTSEETEEVRNL